MKAIITVGSTQFDRLFEVVETKEFIETVFNILKIEKLYIQTGNSKINIKDEFMKNKEIEIFDFDINLDDIFQEWNIVIGHWGAGTITEVLTLGKHLIWVINDGLMDNHQIELASKLSGLDYK